MQWITMKICKSYITEYMYLVVHVCIYYPPEVRRGKYWGLEVFLLQYFPPVST